MRPLSRAALLQTTKSLRDKLATAQNRIDSLEQALQLGEDERAATCCCAPDDQREDCPVHGRSLTEMVAEKDKAWSELLDTRDERDQLSAQLGVEQGRVVELQSSIAGIEDNWSQMVDEERERIAELESDRDRFQQAAEDGATMVAKKQAYIDELKAERDAALGVKDAALERLAFRDKEVEELRADAGAVPESRAVELLGDVVTCAEDGALGSRFEECDDGCECIICAIRSFLATAPQPASDGDWVWAEVPRAIAEEHATNADQPEHAAVLAEGGDVEVLRGWAKADGPGPADRALSRSTITAREPWVELREAATGLDEYDWTDWDGTENCCGHGWDDFGCAIGRVLEALAAVAALDDGEGP